MADFGLYCKNVDIAVRAGTNVNTTAITTAETDKYVLAVESYINVRTKRNWSDDYAALNVDVKDILEDCAACMCAIYAIQYDMSGYTTRGEAQLMVNILRDRYIQDLEVLKDTDLRDFMDSET